MEKVSLYISCHNAERYIRECLDSVINQSYKIDEIMVIDDGSTDKTVDIAKNYPVRIISLKENKGLAACRNIAFKEAKNEFVATLDADCVANPEWLAEMMKCFVADDIAGVGGILIERYTLNIADKWRSARMAQEWGSELLENPPFLFGSNTVLRRGALAKIGFYNEYYRNNYEDVDMSLRAYDRNSRLIYNPKAHAEHIRRDTIHSVARSYWNWIYLKDIRPGLSVNPFRKLCLLIGKIADYPGRFEIFFREDAKCKNYELITLDFFFMVYGIWRDLKELFKFLLREKGDDSNHSGKRCNPDV